MKALLAKEVYEINVPFSDNDYVTAELIIDHDSESFSLNPEGDSRFINKQSDHFLAHGSLNKCVAELLEKQILIFNRETNRYEFNNTKS